MSDQAPKRSIKRFLIVDHEEESQIIIKSLLGQLQIQDITIESTGAAALEQLEPKRIEFMILNWDLAGDMPASTLLQKIKAIGAFRDLPFAIYSERLEDEDISLLKDLSIENIFSAPIDREEALGVLRQAVAKENQLDMNARKLRQASGYLDDNNCAEAMQLVNESLGHEPTKSMAFALKGKVHLKQDQLEEAETSLSKSLEVDEENAVAMQTMAKVYTRTNRHDEAIQMLSQMVELSPKNINSLIGLGAAYVDADDHEKAKAQLDKAAAIDPDNPDLKDQLGKIAFKEKNFDLAQEILAHSLNKDELGRTFNNIGIGQVSKGKFDEGIESYDNAIKILGENKYSHMLIFNKGLALRKKGDLQEAFEMFYQSYLSHPEYDKAYSALIRLVRTMTQEGVEFEKEKVLKAKELRKREVEKLNGAA